MQHDDGRRQIRPRADHAVFELGRADGEEACGCEALHDVPFAKVNPDVFPIRVVPAFAGTTWGSNRALSYADPSRSLKRWILPVAVFGKASTTLIQRGYFQTPIFCLTCSF